MHACFPASLVAAHRVVSLIFRMSWSESTSQFAIFEIAASAASAPEDGRLALTPAGAAAWPRANPPQPTPARVRTATPAKPSRRTNRRCRDDEAFPTSPRRRTVNDGRDTSMLSASQDAFATSSGATELA